MDRFQSCLVAQTPLAILVLVCSRQAVEKILAVRESDIAAATAIRECQRILAAHGHTILHEAMGGAPDDPDAVPWRRYPDDEVYDPVSHAQYFYHSHPQGKLPPNRRSPGRRREEPPRRARPEHGHFHLFLRGQGIPPGLSPMVFPEMALAGPVPAPQAAPGRRGVGDEIAHLVAISLDDRGAPIRLFTTNRWITGETWYRGGDILRMIDYLRFGGDLPSPLLNLWLVALLRLYRDDLADLLEQRDEEIVEWRWRWQRHGNVLDNPRLEVASYRDIDLEARLSAVEASSLEAPVAIWPRPRSLRMAEGWGD